MRGLLDNPGRASLLSGGPKTMTLSIPRFARSLSRHSRRALAALLITGSLLSSVGALPSFANDIQIDPQGVSDEAREAAANALDYWIFSDDYCGWASAEALVAPYSIDPFAVEPARPALTFAASPSESAINTAANVIDQTLNDRAQRERLASELAAIAASEPIDVSVIDELISPEDSSSEKETTTLLSESTIVTTDPLIGSSPVIASLSEGYLPYDISQADQIALRMYPVTIPQFGSSRPASIPAPMDCLGHGVVWNESVLPSQSIETATRSDAVADRFLSSLKIDFDAIFDQLANEASATTQATDAKRNELAVAIVEAVQPASEVRSYLEPLRIGSEAGEGFLMAYQTAEGSLRGATQTLSSSLKPAPQRPRAEVLEQTAGEKLLVRAGVEANSLNCATAGVAEDAVASVCCPVERSEVAAQLPATHHLATVGVAAATLNMPQEPQQVRESIAKAEAIATACDSAAATLERLASALRRAGDSVVRVARASADSGSELR
jgi:hypothetical protein